MKNRFEIVKEIESHSKEILEAFKACKLRSSQAFNMRIDLSKEVFSHLDNGRITRDQFSHLDNILCHHRITVREEVLR